MSSKKYLIIFVLKILETETDENKPLTQLKIAEIISKIYSCDRKTVGRNIGFLRTIGYPIIKTAKGYYLDKKKFTVDETRFILNAVISSPERPQGEKQDIANRLTEVFSKIYR